MKTLLFIGGTTFFGKLAVRKLIASQQYQITLLTRGNHIPAEFAAAVALIRCDRTNREAMRAALQNRPFDVVVDNIAQGAADVAAVLDGMEGAVGHYLLCSSATVYPNWHTPHQWTEAEAMLAPVPEQGPYANGKRAAEQELMERRNVPFTIYRPTVVEGPDDPVSRTRFFVENLDRQRTFFLPADVILQHAYSVDVAEAILSLIALGPDNRSYNISGNDSIPIGMYCDMIAEVLDRPKCYELIGRDRFMATRPARFPDLFDHTLLLSNTSLRQRAHHRESIIQEWLPVTVQWNRDLYCP